MKRKLRTIAVLLTVMTVLSSGSQLADAGTFKRTRTMVITYAWGTSSLAEFDYWNTTYPGYLPTANVTYYTDATFDVVDNASGGTGNGIYDKQGRQLELTILAPSSPMGLIQYAGEKVGRGVFEGEILVNGVPCGHWRGEF